ncbi:MAG: TIGR03757 family integrating conjugative element protein [Halioglobus sp.]|nr:TIGR03757 family integrating conjugative element protein [Halioglobus sp.]
MHARSAYRLALGVACLHLTLAVPALAAPAAVWVFTTAQLPPLQRLELATQVWVLDAIEAPLHALSFPFPGSEEAARRQAVAVINAPRGQAMLAQLRRHAQAVALAWQSGIEKLPAVLVDQRYVVYGEYDVQAALARVARFREEAVRADKAREPSVRLEQVRKALATEMRASYAD